MPWRLERRGIEGDVVAFHVAAENQPLVDRTLDHVGDVR
jgi:hypothetical protein